MTDFYVASASVRPETITDEAIRKLWREAGGSFYGPRVEHANIKESHFLPFMRTLLARIPECDGSGRSAGWQDIRTVPSDGRQIWVYGGRYGGPRLSDADGEWWNSALCPEKSRPTHWMPTPEPPVSSGQNLADATP